MKVPFSHPFSITLSEQKNIGSINMDLVHEAKPRSDIYKSYIIYIIYKLIFFWNWNRKSKKDIEK